MKVDTSFPRLPSSPPDLPKETLLQALKEGDLLQGRVVKQLNDETWMIRVAGRDIVARSSTALVEGRVISARVDALGPPVFLTLLGGGILTDPEEALSRMLLQSGIRDDPLHRAVVLRMMESGLQITGAEVEAVRQALIRLKASAGPKLRDVIDQILRLRARSVPINDETMTLTLPEDGGLSLGQTVDQLFQDLATFTHGDAEVKDLLDRMVRLFIDSDVIDEESVRRGIVDGGLNLEAKLLALLEAADGQPEIGDDLKSLLFALRDLLSTRLTGAISEDERHHIASLLNRLDDTLHLIASFQMTNLPQKTPDPSSYIYL